MTDVPGVQTLLAPDSALPEIPHGGTVWKVGRPDQDAKARLEKLVKRAAIEQVRALKDVLDPPAYREAFDRVTNNLRSYDTWGEGWQAVVGDPAHAHLFLWALLQAHHPTVSEEQVKRLADECPEEVGFALAQVLPDFFRAFLVTLLAKVPPERRAEAAGKAEAYLTALGQQLSARPGKTS